MDFWYKINGNTVELDTELFAGFGVGARVVINDELLFSSPMVLPAAVFPGALGVVEKVQVAVIPFSTNYPTSNELILNTDFHDDNTYWFDSLSEFLNSDLTEILLPPFEVTENLNSFLQGPGGTYDWNECFSLFWAYVTLLYTLTPPALNLGDTAEEVPGPTDVLWDNPNFNDLVEADGLGQAIETAMEQLQTVIQEAEEAMLETEQVILVNALTQFIVATPANPILLPVENVAQWDVQNFEETDVDAQEDLVLTFIQNFIEPAMQIAIPPDYIPELVYYETGMTLPEGFITPFVVTHYVNIINNDFDAYFPARYDENEDALYVYMRPFHSAQAIADFSDPNILVFIPNNNPTACGFGPYTNFYEVFTSHPGVEFYLIHHKHEVLDFTEDAVSFNPDLFDPWFNSFISVASNISAIAPHISTWIYELILSLNNTNVTIHEWLTNSPITDINALGVFNNLVLLPGLDIQDVDLTAGLPVETDQPQDLDAVTLTVDEDTVFLYRDNDDLYQMIEANRFDIDVFNLNSFLYNASRILEMIPKNLSYLTLEQTVKTSPSPSFSALLKLIEKDYPDFTPADFIVIPGGFWELRERLDSKGILKPLHKVILFFDFIPEYQTYAYSNLWYPSSNKKVMIPQEAVYPIDFFRLTLDLFIATGYMIPIGDPLNPNSYLLSIKQRPHSIMGTTERFVTNNAASLPIDLSLYAPHHNYSETDLQYKAQIAAIDSGESDEMYPIIYYLLGSLKDKLFIKSDRLSPITSTFIDRLEFALGCSNKIINFYSRDLIGKSRRKIAELQTELQDARSNTTHSEFFNPHTWD
jgi:hypothetical protein